MPRPAAGTIAVHGIGTSSGRDIVHTIALTGLPTLHGRPNARPVIVEAWQPRPRPRCGNSCWPPADALPTRVRAAEARALSEHLSRLLSSGTHGLRIRAGGHRARVRSRCSTCCCGSSVRVLLPVARTAGDGTPLPLRWGEYRPGGLVRGRWGLLEPPEPWLPESALARGRAGARSGAGGRPPGRPAGPRRRLLRPLTGRPEPARAAGRDRARRRSWSTSCPPTRTTCAMTHALTPRRGLVALPSGGRARGMRPFHGLF